jgi:hypothetical protein
MSYVLINRAEDGVHTKVYQTQQAALDAMFWELGLHADFYSSMKVGQTYTDDWGRRFTVEERRSGHTAKREDALRRAYDARECGYATKRQLAMLEKEGF